MYIYVESDQSCWANNLRKSVNNGIYTLKWDAAPACGFLLFKSDLDADIANRIESLCEKMTDMNFTNSNVYTEIDKGIFVKSLPFGIKNTTVVDSGRYYVYACKKEGDIYKVYAPPTSGMGEHFADIFVKLEINVSIREENKEVTEGMLFNKKTYLKPSGFYFVSFMDGFDVSKYKDGDIYYMVHGVKIPITKIMIEKKEIYIKTDNRPELKTDNRFLEVIEK